MAVADTRVRHYLSTMPGVPVLNSTAGSLISVLDACLVDGFGSVTLDTLSVANNVATATVATGHGFSMLGGAQGVGPVIRIAGASPNALNGDWRIASVPNPSTFTFVVDGIADQVASGTLSARIAPMGWVKVFSGTNKAVYGRSDPNATAMLLRVDDTYTNQARVRGYESMIDADNGEGMFPTLAQHGATAFYWAKATPWRLFADSLRLLYFPMRAASVYAETDAFGDVIPYLSGDAYHCCITATTTETGGAPNAYFLTSNYTQAATTYFPRSLSQIGSAVSSRAYIGYGGLVGTVGAAYPNPANNALLLRGELELMELPAAALRGRWPGLASPLHVNPGVDGDVISGLSDNGRVLLQKLVTYNPSSGIAYGTVAVNLLKWE